MLETDVRTLLLTDTGIAAAVGERIRPGEGVQGEPRPLITYVASADDTQMLMDGPSEFSTAAMEFTIEGSTYLQCRQLAALVKAKLNGYAGRLSTVQIIPATLTEDGDIDEVEEEGTDTSFFACVQTYTFLYRAI